MADGDSDGEFELSFDGGFAPSSSVIRGQFEVTLECFGEFEASCPEDHADDDDLLSPHATLAPASSN